MGAVVEAEVYTSAKVALLVEVVAIVVIEPTPAASGRAMMLRCCSTYHKWWHWKTKWQILRVEYHSYLDITKMGR
jgi:hypothetical protein